MTENTEYARRPYPPEYVPVLFEIELATRQASGVVHPFCTDKCRGKATATAPEGFFLVGNLTRRIDFPEDTHCETCGVQIDRSETKK